jgi:hypothetical protein
MGEMILVLAVGVGNEILERLLPNYRRAIPTIMAVLAGFL